MNVKIHVFFCPKVHQQGRDSFSAGGPRHLAGLAGIGELKSDHKWLWVKKKTLGDHSFGSCFFFFLNGVPFLIQIRQPDESRDP